MTKQNIIRKYVEEFANIWQSFLDEDEVLRADVHLNSEENLLAIEFYISEQGDEWDLTPKINTWENLIKQFTGEALCVTDQTIIILKKNDDNCWTASDARIDAESAFTKRMFDTAESAFTKRMFDTMEIYND